MLSSHLYLSIGDPIFWVFIESYYEILSRQYESWGARKDALDWQQETEAKTHVQSTALYLKKTCQYAGIIW